jgi:ABC-type multidrug transport system fused ATPase/permease subunit
VLDHGSVAEVGGHDELLQRGTHYARLAGQPAALAVA